MKTDGLSVSVIMPYVNEWPQVAFTIRAVREELEGFCPYEIIMIDNFCPEVENQGQFPDRGHDSYMIEKKVYPFYNITDADKERAKFNPSHIKAQASLLPWLSYQRYEKKLSHWNAKNIGVANSSGHLLLFLDAHVIPSNGSIRWQYSLFKENLLLDENFWMNTIHLPLSYHIMESKRLAYKLIWEPEAGVAHYRFVTYDKGFDVNQELAIKDGLVELPCMSTCGMMMHRDLYDLLGGWPEGMGIYGGGENFINYTMSTIGAKKYLSKYGTLHHHGDKRGYSFYWDDYHRNRMIATAIYGGAEMLVRYQEALAGPDNEHTKDLMEEAWKASEKHRAAIGPKQIIDLAEWAEKWKEN